MKLRKSLQLSFNILQNSKLRSWLTIIGIIIGIAAIVSIVSISNGAKQSLEERLGGLGADVITISPGFSQASGSGGHFRRSFGETSPSAAEQKNLTSKDAIALKGVQNIKYIMGSVSERADIAYSGKTASVSVSGVDTLVWKDITTETIASGRYLTKGDAYSVVLGGRIVESTFEEGIPLNRRVTIEGKSFKVVGILESGSTIYMPIEIARIILEDVGDKEFDSISVKIEDVDLSDDTVASIEKKLMMSRGILQERERDFSVSSVKAMQETMSATMDTMSLFLSAIAAISLLVGAVGIANSMFTSVLEKTKEIGIMKSIGAKNRDIMLIFLFNAGMIGLVGGIGGVILGSIISSIIGSAGGLSPSNGMMRMFSSTLITPQLIIGTLLLAVLIGMIAGAIPAYRASKLDPVDALRYE